MTARRQLVEIFDRRTGETWTHVATKREGTQYAITVKNDTTGQLMTVKGGSAKFALLDALVACGCPRNVATDAAKASPLW